MRVDIKYSMIYNIFIVDLLDLKHTKVEIELAIVNCFLFEHMI